MRPPETHLHRITLVSQGPKGEIFKNHGYWHWRRNSGAVERFPKRMTLIDVAEHVAHLCRADGKFILEKI
jgi:hypothetical protein